MAKTYEKKVDSGTMSKIIKELNLYIDSIKEDIAYEELDKNVERDAIVEQLVQYYTNNPMDDTMSYDDWVNDFINGNDLKENRYKPQIKDYLRNIVAIIYSNISEVEDEDDKEDRIPASDSKYVFSEYINIADNAANYRISIAQNGSIAHHITNIPTTLGKAFKNRDLLIQRAEEKLNACSKIYFEDALPGTGRKTFAKELYTKINSDYNYSAWIRLDGDLRQSMLDSMTIYPATGDTETRYAQIVVFLKSKKRRILFVIDNTYGNSVTEDELKFIDQIRCDVIFINDPHINGVEQFNVNMLSLDQCIDVFYEYYALDKAHKFIDIVEEYVELSGRNVYLIKLLAKAAKGSNLAEFLHRIRNDGFVYNDLTGMDEKSASILTARNIIKLMKISNVSDSQYDILKYFAVMPDIDIPSDIVEALQINPEDINTLVNLGLVDCAEKPNYGTIYYIHPLMRTALNMQFDIKPKDCRKLITLIINGGYIKTEDTFSKFMTKLKIADGVLSVFAKQRFEEKGELFNAVGCWFYNCSEYEKALELCNKAVNIREKIPVVNHPATAIVYDNISRVYNAVEDFDNAINYGEKALYIYEQYGDAYEDKIAGICMNLGDAYNGKDEHSKAVEYYNRALEIREKTPMTLTLADVYSKLGAVHNEMHNPELAIDFYNKAMKIKEKLLGTDSPVTAMTYNSLALIYKEQGDFDKSLDYNNKTLKIRERVLGTEHPLTARTYNHLGRIYLNKGDYAKALDYYVKAYKIVKHIYGDAHPKTRLIKDNLEATYRRSFEKWLGEQMKDKD